MPATHLRCTQCGTETALEAVSSCERCFAPLEPVYDLDVVRREATRERIAAGPPSLWRYAPLLPVAPPEPALLAPGFTPLVAAPRLAAELGVGELYLKLDTANPTHSFKDRVVAVAAAKAQELGLEALACASTGNLANAVAARAAVEGMPAAIFCPADVEREKLLASAAHGATIYAVRGNYDACSRLTIELSFELPWAFVNVTLRAYYAEGSKTLAYEVVEQLGWELPDVVVVPVASGSLLQRTERGFEDFRSLGLVDGPAPRLIGCAARGLLAGRDGVCRGPRSAARAAGHRRAVARDRESGRRRRRDRGGAAVGRRDPRRGRGRRSARTCCCSPRPPACSARRRPASRSAHCGPRSTAARSALATGSCCS